MKTRATTQSPDAPLPLANAALDPMQPQTRARQPDVEPGASAEQQGGSASNVEQSPKPVVATATIPALNAEGLPVGTPPTSLGRQRLKLERRESAALLILTTLGVLYTLYATRAIMLPMTFAFLTALTLRPLVRKLRRWKLPEPVAAGLTIFTLLATFALMAVNLVGPAKDWMQQMPENVARIQQKVQGMQSQMRDLIRTSERVQQMAQSTSGNQPVPVQIAQSSLSTNVALISNTGNFLASGLLVLCLAFFLLGWGDRLLNNVLRLLNSWSDKKRTVEFVYEVERGIASYLGTVTMINIALGLAVTVAMWLLGVPNPALWGLMATVFNYVPIFGALVGIVILLVVSLLSFDSLAYAVVPPLVYATLTTVEGNFITPSVLGKSMSLNPILVIVSLVFWGWIWGVGGAFLAVPLLAVLKLTCEHFERTRPIAVLIEA